MNTTCQNSGRVVKSLGMCNLSTASLDILAAHASISLLSQSDVPRLRPLEIAAGAVFCGFGSGVGYGHNGAASLVAGSSDPAVSQGRGPASVPAFESVR